jgi:hypothetical protein
MSRSERWTVAAGRQILFDGQPFIGINREGNAEPVEADSVTNFIAQCLNQAAMTPDELYRRHMGYARRRRTSEVHAPATRSAHAPPSSRAATGCRACRGASPGECDGHGSRDRGERPLQDIHRPDAPAQRKLERELMKCVALCSNCHRKAHAGHILVPADLLCRSTEGEEAA